MATCTIQTAQVTQASLFERETLQFTVRLLRSHDPSLALSIQNLIAPTAPLFKAGEVSPGPHDIFRLTLNSIVLKQVIDTLAEVGQQVAEEVLKSSEGNHSFLLSTKETIGKWLIYARYHQGEYERLNPAAQRSALEVT